MYADHRTQLRDVGNPGCKPYLGGTFQDFSTLAEAGAIIAANTAGDLINRATSDVDNIRR